MATVKIIQRTSKVKKNGEAPLYLRITKDRKSKFVSLRVFVVPKDWDSDTEQVKRSYPNSVRMNRFLAEKRKLALSAVLDLETAESSVSSSKIKQEIVGTGGISFVDYCDAYLLFLKHTAKMGTLDKAKAVVSKLKSYLNGMDLTFSDLTVPFLNQYEYHLLVNLGNSTNTVHSNLKVIRRIINKAINEELFPFEKNPFHRFKLKLEKTKMEFLTEDEVMAIEEIEIPE
ncbi:MAG: integrase/recombinase XerD, partial [Bacteroidia bacterium]